MSATPVGRYVDVYILMAMGPIATGSIIVCRIHLYTRNVCMGWLRLVGSIKL